MTTNAAFKIRNVTSGGAWSAFSDRGFDCDHGDELEVMLENQPALDVRTGVFSSVSSSKDAPDLTYSSSGVLATAASTITITVPAAAPGLTADSWIVRSQTNGGEAVLVNGQWNYTINTAERMICVRSGGLRKIIATERDQYSEAGGWADAQNEEVEVFGSGLDSVTSAVSTLTASVSAATSGITSLTTRVSTEESTRASADTSLTTRLSSEESARASADTSLETRLSTEESSRTSADTSLETRISTEESTRASAVTSLESAAGARQFTRTWSCSNVIAGSSPITPAYMIMGGSMTTTPATTPLRQERAVVKMKPLSATVQGVAGSGTGTIRFEIYVGGSATGDYVECGNNTTGLNKTTMPVQGTINVNDIFDLRFSITSGSTISAMSYVSVVVLFEEVP